MTTELLVGVIGFGTAVVGLITALLSRNRRVLHHHEHIDLSKPERPSADREPDIDLELVGDGTPAEQVGGPSAGGASHTPGGGTKDGLNSGILPSTRGASGGLGLPPRTHAIHKILFFSTVPLSLKEIEARLSAWGYERETVGVTRNHLRSLCKGWGKDNVVAVAEDGDGKFVLTPEGRERLAAGPFSTDLP